jgi:hypothetical protein
MNSVTFTCHHFGQPYYSSLTLMLHKLKGETSPVLFLKVDFIYVWRLSVFLSFKAVVGGWTKISMVSNY